MAPEFSIIIPVYCSANFLETCLASLRGQTISSWEALCVDDGSTDSSGEMLLETVRQDARCRMVFQRNAGVSAARNRALERATGTYVGFLDSDDVVASWWLEEAQIAFDTHKVEMVRFGAVDWTEPTPPQPIRDGGDEVLRTAEECYRWGWWVYTFAGYPWRYFYRREIACAVRFPEGLPIKEDCIYGFRLLPLLTSACNSQKSPYLYRILSSSASHSTYSIDVPIRLLDECMHILRQPLSTPQYVSLRRVAVAQFMITAITGWLQYRRREDLPRMGELRIRLQQLLSEKLLSFKELVRPHWRPSVACFLIFGWRLPMIVHGALFQWYLKFRYAVMGPPPSDFSLTDARLYQARGEGKGN